MTLTHDVRLTLEKIHRRIELITPLVHRRTFPIAPFRLKRMDDPRQPAPHDEDSLAWETIPPDTYWGEKGLNFALAGSFTVPTDFDTSAPLMLYLPLGVSGDFDHPEALVDIDGAAYAGCDRNHQLIRLADTYRDGREHLLLLHGYCGMLGDTRDSGKRKLFMGQPALVQVDQPLRDFLAMARIALGAAEYSDVNNPVRDRLLNALDHAFLQLDLRQSGDDLLGDAFYASVPLAHAALKEKIPDAGVPMDVHIHATGHAHIDVAWLWTVDQTRRKAERTFSTALRMMEEFPDFRFVASTPQVYDFIRQDQPALFEQIKERIREGRWETIGGMWVEADCNIPGGESLVRQLMLGRQFFKDHFGEGAESPVLWLPDVFGYAWNLPQLIKGAGLEYFFTIKIGWNQYNRLPYDTFWWQGLDGTRVLTHFSTTPEHHDIHSHATYNADPDSKTAIGTWLNLQQKHLTKDVLMSYGWGDGGGGPTREMIEHVRELEAMPGVPQVRHNTVKEFFEHIEREIGDKLPVWNGELYLEFHRGTYTTQARNKRANRQSESALHAAEFLATYASLIDKTYQYPHDTLRRAWELVCLNQFHDIIPGSSIGEVYKDSLAQYDEVSKEAEKVYLAALDVIAHQVGGDALVVNPCGETSYAPIAAGSPTLGYRYRRAASPTFPDYFPSVQEVSSGEQWLYQLPLPPYSVQTLSIEPGEGRKADGMTLVTVSLTHLENAVLRIEFNPAGDITRIYEKPAQRDVLPSGAFANEFIAYEDRPNNWDAWDIDMVYSDKSWRCEPAESIRVVEDSGIYASVEIKRRILNSTITQRISLHVFSAVVEFSTTIEWHERHILLKAAFPAEVLSPIATYEVQWGNVQRPTHANTSWDWARFETCAQKWVALSEGRFGISVINNGIYGNTVRDNVIYLSLLRGSTNPDPQADQGVHQIHYRLLVHGGSMIDALDATVAEAYALNNPPRLNGTQLEPGVEPPLRSLDSLVQVTKDGLTPTLDVVLETVKRAEDNRGVIIRAYEYCRSRGSADFTFGFDIREAWLTSILEMDIERVEVIDQRRVRVYMTPFQIVTLRLIPADE